MSSSKRHLKSSENLAALCTVFSLLLFCPFENFANRTIRNNEDMLAETRSYIFGWQWISLSSTWFLFKLLIPLKEYISRILLILWAPNITGLAGFKLKRVALSELSNWFTYPHRCPVLSTKFLGANGDLMVSMIECSTYASNTILPPMGKFFHYTISGYDAKSSKIVWRGSWFHSSCPLPKNYGCCTTRVLEIGVNMIVTGPRAPMFLLKNL